MNEHLGKQLLYAPVTKCFIKAGLFVVVMFFIVESYNVFFLGRPSFEPLLDDLMWVILFGFLYLVVIRENQRLLKHLRTKTGAILLWLGLVILILITSDYPVNVIWIGIFLLALGAYFGRRFLILRKMHKDS